MMTRTAGRRGLVPAAIAALALGLPAFGDGRGPSSPPDEPILTRDGLVFPPDAAIPKSLTQTEREYWRRTGGPIFPDGAFPSPTGPIYCPPEYDPMDGLQISWRGTSSWKSILATMGRHITTTGDADLHVMVSSGSQQNEATNMLASAGADMNRVFFSFINTDTIWIRDYGPRYIYEGPCRAIIDHTYNRPRPLDNAQPGNWASQRNHAIYEIPLIHGGGNYHLDGVGYGYTTRLINNENPQLTEAQIHALWMEFQNLDTEFFDPFPTSVDSTQHIDMWMQVIADDAVVISDWPFNPGSIQEQICNAAAAWFAARNYSVYRTPARRVSSTHYTYTNVVLCNDLVLIPSYTNSQVVQHNAEALAAWQSAMPGKTIVQINCEAIVSASGVMHCIVMHVPAHLGGENPTIYMRNFRGGEHVMPGEPHTIHWISDDNIGTDRVAIRLSTDSGQTWTTLAANQPDTGSWLWTVPEIDTARARLRLRVTDGDENNGIDQSDFDFTIGDPAVLAPLTDFALAFGIHIEGGLADLAESNDTYLQTRSQFGFSATEPNLMEILFGAMAIENGDEFEVSIESRLNNPGGAGTIRLYDWTANIAQIVHTHPTEQTDTVESFTVPGASTFIRNSDGRVEMSVRHAVVATFSAAGFDSYFDWIEILVRE